MLDIYPIFTYSKRYQTESAYSSLALLPRTDSYRNNLLIVLIKRTRKATRSAAKSTVLYYYLLISKCDY